MVKSILQPRLGCNLMYLKMCPLWPSSWSSCTPSFLHLMSRKSRKCCTYFSQFRCLVPMSTAQTSGISHLLVCVGGCKEINLSPRNSYWVIDDIAQSYKVPMASPLGIRAHITMSVKWSSALAWGTLLHDAFAVAGWSSLHTFIRLYSWQVDLESTPGSQVLWYWSSPSNHPYQFAQP